MYRARRTRNPVRHRSREAPARARKDWWIVDAVSMAFIDPRSNAEVGRPHLGDRDDIGHERVDGRALAAPNRQAVHQHRMNSAREQARAVQCLSNLREMVVACQAYATTFRGYYPPAIHGHTESVKGRPSA